MSVSFNVLDAPWIPVVCMDGSRELLGIRETLRRAPELKEISAVSPLEEFSVYRFLSVFLMDALRPGRNSDIKKLLKRGSFDMEQIEAYIALCEGEGVSFDLFDKNRPFLQAAYVKNGEKNPESASRLDFAQPNGNNHVHFEHGSGADYCLSFAEALPKLIAANLFATNGGSGYQPSISSSQGTNPYMVLINGKNLFQTLCFMLLPVSEHDYGDSPHGTWMMIPEPQQKEIPDLSFLRMMLYPVRSILLIPEEARNLIPEVHYCVGYKLPVKGVWRDPNAAYQIVSRKKDDDDGIDKQWVPVVPNSDVAPWRNYAEITRTSGRPDVVSRFVKYDLGWNNATITLYGLHSDNAKCISTVRCGLRIHKSLLESEYREDVVYACMQDADSIGNALKKALLVALQHQKKDVKVADFKKANAKAKETANTYYARCEGRFWQLLDEMDSHQDEDMEGIMESWKRDVFHIARQEFEKAVSSVLANGRMLRQIAEGEEILRGWNKTTQRGTRK